MLWNALYLVGILTTLLQLRCLTSNKCTPNMGQIEGKLLPFGFSICRDSTAVFSLYQCKHNIVYALTGIGNTNYFVERLCQYIPFPLTWTAVSEIWSGPYVSKIHGYKVLWVYCITTLLNPFFYTKPITAHTRDMQWGKWSSVCDLWPVVSGKGEGDIFLNVHWVSPWHMTLMGVTEIS